MPDVVGGWVRSLLGTLGAMLGVKLYILGVMGYDKPIWDVLVLQGEQEEAGEHLHSAKFENYVPIRQLVPVGLPWARFCSWARCAQFFIERNLYIARYSISTYITKSARWM